MNTFGDKIKITVFGESHAEAIGVTVDGLPAGTPVDTNYIQSLLDLRAPGKSDTAKGMALALEHRGRLLPAPDDAVGIGRVKLQ